MGKTKRRIITLLLGGVALGLSGSPRAYFKTLRAMREEFRGVNDQSLRRSIKSLYDSNIIREEFNEGGTVTLVLSKKGKEVALTYAINPIEIKKPKKWDKKWRIVIFDIPEKRRKERDTFRFHLQHMDFYELQKSVFVHSYDCKEDIEYLLDEYNIRKHVYFIIADVISSEEKIKKHFKLIQ